MQYMYSYFGSRLHLLLDEEVANTWNRAQQKFFDAQTNHKERTGRDWTQNETLAIDWTKEEATVWNGFSEFMNHYIAFAGGHLEIREEDMTEDFLIKVESESS